MRNNELGEEIIWLVERDFRNISYRSDDVIHKPQAPNQTPSDPYSNQPAELDTRDRNL